MKAHHGDEAWLAALHGNACRGKIRHPSKKHAKAAGRRMTTYRGFVLNAYRCSVCGHWHLGNSPKRFMRDLVDASSLAPVANATPLERAVAEALRPYLGHNILDLEIS